MDEHGNSGSDRGPDAGTGEADAGTYAGTPAEQAEGGEASGRPGTYPGTPAEAED